MTLPLITSVLLLYYIKQIDSMLLCVCPEVDHISDTLGRAPCATFCLNHILTSPVISYCTNTRQHEIYLLK